MSRLILLSACLFAAAGLAKHHVQYSSWDGYTAGMILPDTIAEATSVAEGSCNDGCQNTCYGTYSYNSTCYALFVHPGSNYTLPDDGAISWKFVTRDCDAQINYIDYTGACVECPTGTVGHGNGCATPQIQEAGVILPAGAGVSPMMRAKGRLRHRQALRARAARQSEDSV